MIPDWSISAVLPPVRPGLAGHHSDRSPYLATMSEVLERFATSAERLAILRGLLGYRSELRRRGISEGFQWLDGSFMEDKETLEKTAPNDVDVITFFHLPNATDQATFLNTNSELFDEDAMKTRYLVHPFPFVLGETLTSFDVRQITYWYSMWSHRRTGLWKGFVQVNLSEEHDAEATALLHIIEQDWDTP